MRSQLELAKKNKGHFRAQSLSKHMYRLISSYCLSQGLKDLTITHVLVSHKIQHAHVFYRGNIERLSYKKLIKYLLQNLCLRKIPKITLKAYQNVRQELYSNDLY